MNSIGQTCQLCGMEIREKWEVPPAPEPEASNLADKNGVSLAHIQKIFAKHWNYLDGARGHKDSCPAAINARKAISNQQMNPDEKREEIAAAMRDLESWAREHGHIPEMAQIVRPIERFIKLGDGGFDAFLRRMKPADEQ